CDPGARDPLPPKLSLRGSPRLVTHGSAEAFSLAPLLRRQPAYAVSLRRAGNFLLPVSHEPDSGARIFRDRRWRSRSPSHFVDVLPLALVGWTRDPLRPRTSSHRRSGNRSHWLRTVRYPGHVRLLLEHILSRLPGSWPWNGDQRPTADHGRNGRSWPGIRGRRLRYQQRRRPRRWPARHRNLWHRDGR